MHVCNLCIFTEYSISKLVIISLLNKHDLVGAVSLFPLIVLPLDIHDAPHHEVGLVAQALRPEPLRALDEVGELKRVHLAFLSVVDGAE